MANQSSSIQSLVTFRNSQGDAARGTLLKLNRTIAVFEVYNPYSIVQLSEVLKDLTIRRKERVIYQGKAVVSNLVNTGLMLIVSVKLLDAWVGLSTLIRDNAYTELNSELAEFILDWEKANRLRETFLLAVNRLRSFLGELNRWLGHLDIYDGQESSDLNSDFAMNTVQTLGEQLFPKLEDLFKHFEYEAGLIPSDELDQHKAFAQRDLHPLILSSPFLQRTFSKPLGYAGDYEMMNMIQRCPADGNTIYAKLVNTLFLRAAIPQSVRNRTETLYRYLAEESKRAWNRHHPFRSMNIGCGPALEVQQFVAEHKEGEPCDITLLDFNSETLRHAEGEIESIRAKSANGVSVHYLKESVHNLLKLAPQLETEHKDYDYVYCSGLFDYLSDRVCARLLRLFYSWTRPGGAVFVTNMHKSNPDRHIMDYLMEWYLIYRDEKSMEQLCPGLGIQRVFVDQTGVNICLEIRKP